MLSERDFEFGVTCRCNTQTYQVSRISRETPAFWTPSPAGTIKVTASTKDGPIERVIEFKLLGVYVDSNLSWKKHIEHVTCKATKRLHFLKVLKC